jgi:hypothetical protein
MPRLLLACSSSSSITSGPCLLPLQQWQLQQLPAVAIKATRQPPLWPCSSTCSLAWPARSMVRLAACLLRLQQQQRWVVTSQRCQGWSCCAVQHKVLGACWEATMEHLVS